MRHFYFLILFLCFFTSASAYDVIRKGVYYNLDNELKTATVTYKKISVNEERTDYTDVVTVPDSIVVDKGHR